MRTSRVTTESGQVTLPLGGSGVRAAYVMAAFVVGGQLLGTVVGLGLAFEYGVSVLALGTFLAMYVVTTLSVTIGFHRYFSHRSFKTSRAAEALFIALGSMSFQGPLTYWVATHRRHHKYSDSDLDPHSPHLHGDGFAGLWRGFWHSHVGWLFSEELSNPSRFARDILRDSFVFRLQSWYMVWAGLGLAIPALVGWVGTGTLYGTLEVFLWGGPIRLFAVSNASWSVGSFSHLYGQRPFNTGDHSANNLCVAVFAFGEGLQNNHHAFPSAARHSFRWYEPDFSGWIVTLLEKTGIVWDLHRPTTEEICARLQAARQTMGAKTQ